MPRLAQCLLKLPQESIATALTSKSCSVDGNNYEKLEWLGDAVVKLAQTDSLLYSAEFSDWAKFLSEGDLSILRAGMYS